MLLSKRWCSVALNVTNVSAGQVYWTAALSPPKWKRFLSYVNGSATSLGWIFANTGTFVLSAQIISAAAQVGFPEYKVKLFHIFLMSLSCATLGLILNIWLFNFYPHMTKFMVVFINLGSVYILVALLVRTHPKASAHTVFVEVINATGWSSDGLVFLLCFLPGYVAVSSFDTAAHMSEEMDAPDRQVPLVMMGSSIMSVLTGIPMILVYLFCSSQPERLLSPVGGQPIFQLFLDGFDSKVLFTIALVIYCLVYLSSCPATIATGSRLIWSFAKHGALPFPEWVGYVEQHSQIPTNAVYLTTITSALIGLLMFGPSTILNGIFGASAVCFFFSYGLPIWLNVGTRRRHLHPQRYFNLGKFGFFINYLAIAWQILTVIFLNFPTYQPVTPTNMNWASVCGVTGLVIFGINWLVYARTHYHAPHALFVEHLAARLQVAENVER